MMEIEYLYGYPTHKRIELIDSLYGRPLEQHYLDYRGQHRPLPVIELPIECFVSRIENIRTRSLQKEWLAIHPDEPKNLFQMDPMSDSVQEIQHQLLCKLIDGAGLLDAFKDGKTFQTEVVICTRDGVLVNGNRRVCAWRKLYYENKDKYRHFQTVRAAILPDSDPQGVYDLEVALQIAPDMKDQYLWHAIAADYKEQRDRPGFNKAQFVKKQGIKAADFDATIEAYDYAEEYLRRIGHPDEWSMVDEEKYAFGQIVSSRNSLKDAADKELFRVLAYALIEAPSKGDRLYSVIPKVAKQMEQIVPKLEEHFPIEDDDDDDEDDWLGGGDGKEDNSHRAELAVAIREANQPETVVAIVKNAIEEAEARDHDKNKAGYLLDQVGRAASAMTNAVMNKTPQMDTEGIEAKLASIEGSIEALRNWLKQI